MREFLSRGKGVFNLDRDRKGIVLLPALRMKDLDFEKFGKFICNLVSRVGSFFDAK